MATIQGGLGSGVTQGGGKTRGLVVLGLQVATGSPDREPSSAAFSSGSAPPSVCGGSSPSVSLAADQA